MMQSINLPNVEGPHQNVSVLLQGNITDPKRALLLFHGRGSSAENILRLVEKLAVPNDVLVCAPTAAGNTWYPHRFIEGRQQNEPYLGSALSVVESLIEYIDEKYDIAPSSAVIAGFSQGACLVADYIAHEPMKYAGAVVLSGGIIGTDEEIAHAELRGDLEQTPIYIGCDESDAHIPKERVELTSEILNKLNSAVTTKIYKGLGHAIHPDAYAFLNSVLK